MTNSESNNTNNVKEKKTAEQVISEVSSDDDNDTHNVVHFIGDQAQDEHLIRFSHGPYETEHSIKAAPAPEKGRAFIKRNMSNPEAAKAKSDAEYQSLVEEVASRLSNDIATGTVPDFGANVTPELLGQIFSDARALVQERSKSLEESREARQQAFRERLMASREQCPACHLILGFSEDSLDNHIKSCASYQERVRKEQAHTLNVRGHQSQLNRLLNIEIRNAVSSVTGVMDSINELIFDINEAKYNSKDPAFLEAWAHVKEHWNRQSDYERQRRMQAMEKMQKFATTLLQFYDKLDETDEETEADEEVRVSGR